MGIARNDTMLARKGSNIMKISHYQDWVESSVMGVEYIGKINTNIKVARIGSNSMGSTDSTTTAIDDPFDRQFISPH